MLIGIACCPVLAQEELGAYCSDSTYCNPSIIGALRPKGIVYKNEFGTVRIKNDSESLKALNQLTTYKVKIPVLNKEKFKFAVGLFHYNEDYFLDAKAGAIPEVLSIDDNDFRSFGLNTYILKPFLGNKYLSFRTSTSIAGRVKDQAKQFLKYSVSFLKGKKRNRETIIAWGAAFRYSLGNIFALPLFYYLKSFNTHWSMDLQLPILTRFRWTSGDRKNVFMLENKFSGGRYRLNYDNMNQLIPDNMYSSTDFSSTIQYEREIYDFLWFNLFAGYKSNLRSTVFDSDYTIQRGVIYGFSVFMVPP